MPPPYPVRTVYTSSTDEALSPSLVESNKPLAQQHSRVVRSRQDLSSDASTPATSAGSSAVAGSPILLPATSLSSAEVPSGGENKMRLAGRSHDAFALGASGGPPTTIGGEAAGDVGTTISGIGIGSGTATGSPMARRKPVPSLVPPPVLVIAVGGEGEKRRDANGNISSSMLPVPLTPSPLPSPNRAYLSPNDAEGGKRWSGSYSDDTLAVMEEQRRKRAVLHGRYQHDATEDDAMPEPDPEEEKEGEQSVGDAHARLKHGGGGIIPFPGKRDSMGYPPSTTQRQLLQTTGATAKRRREQVRDSTYSSGTKNTNGDSFKGCTSISPPFSGCFVPLFVTCYPFYIVWRVRTNVLE